MTDFRRPFLPAALFASALGFAACASNGEPSSEAPARAIKTDDTAGSATELPTYLVATPDEVVPVAPRAVRPLAAITGPRDGKCVEATDATGICSLASGRSHFYACAVGGAPPKPLPDCKGVGGSTHWCCF